MLSGIGSGAANALRLAAASSFLAAASICWRSSAVALVAQQHPAELHQRIGFLHVCQLILVAIESMLIRVGVRTDTYAIGMYYNRSTVGYSKFTGFGHGIHRVKYILSIAMNDAEVLKTGEVIGHFTIGSLILLGTEMP